MKGSTNNINVGKAERWASILGGGALALYGLTRDSVQAKAALSIIGGYLFYRGQQVMTRFTRQWGWTQAN